MIGRLLSVFLISAVAPSYAAEDNPLSAYIVCVLAVQEEGRSIGDNLAKAVARGSMACQTFKDQLAADLKKHHVAGDLEKTLHRIDVEIYRRLKRTEESPAR